MSSLVLSPTVPYPQNFLAIPLATCVHPDQIVLLNHFVHDRYQGSYLGRIGYYPLSRACV